MYRSNDLMFFSFCFSFLLRRKKRSFWSSLEKMFNTILLHTISLLTLSTATASFPTDSIATSFSCKTAQRCDVGFPGCYPIMNTTYFVDFAIDDNNVRTINGPTSLLKKNENNVVINRYDLGFQYAMWVDVSGSSKQILNCTRLNVTAIHMTKETLRESFLGYSYKSNNASSGRVPCSPGLRSEKDEGEGEGVGKGDCDEWIWVSEFGCGPAGHQVLGTEPEIWRLNTSSTSTTTILSSMTNEILYPKACQLPGTPTHIAAVIDYTRDWVSHPAASLFTVPSDSECPLAVDVEHFQKQIHSSLSLLLSRSLL